jgi:alpha-L-fucosidase 2
VTSRSTRKEPPDEEVEASRAALSLRLAEASGYTRWSQAWVLCLAARLRHGMLAERAIETLLGPLSSRSLLDLHPLEGWPGGAVFQIDGNLSAVAGIADLLLQSHHEIVPILPALPAGWPSGKPAASASAAVTPSILSGGTGRCRAWCPTP